MPLSLYAAVGGGFLPHGYCYLWNRPLLLTHLVSDTLIGLSYVVISLSLGVLVYRLRHDIPFRIIFVAFGLFIIACGMTHFMEVWTLWRPYYWLSGYVKVVTAIASVTTAIAFPFIVPRVQETVRDAKLSHERALAEERAAAMHESNLLLQNQAIELDQQREEAELLAEELEEANVELRSALAEAAHARDESERANQAKSTFLTTMSHELRTPLNAIIGYQSLLADGITGPVTPPQVQQLERIKASATHLLGLIDEILTLSRVEAGKEDLHINTAPIDAVLDEAAAMIAPQALAKHIDVRLTKPSPSFEIDTDHGKLRQILLNLLTNAVKFTDHGSVIVIAKREGEYATISVRDTGIGISAEHLTQIFDPFWQVQQSTTRTVGGTGLGLSVTRRLTELLGGTILVESMPGEGSTFTLRIPLSRRDSSDFS